MVNINHCIKVKLFQLTKRLIAFDKESPTISVEKEVVTINYCIKCKLH